MAFVKRARFLFSRKARRSREKPVRDVVDEDIHKFGFPQIENVIEKTVKETDTRRGPRDVRARFWFSREASFRFISGPAKTQKQKKTVKQSPVMLLQKGVSQKHHSQCPNFRVNLPDSSGCPVEN